MTFDVPIDYRTTSQSLLNIDDRTRTNVFAWNGQFSPQFIETMLTQFAGEDVTVYDPFMGSGTVLGESARLGLASFGTELNAAPYYMSKIYELCNLDLLERHRLLCDLEESMTDIHAILESDDDIIKCLVILLDLFNNEPSMDLAMQKWDKLKELIMQLPYSARPIHAYMGDSRTIDLPEDSASFMITSPPYINVFNYHQKYRRSVEALGYDVLRTARSEIGANRKNRQNRLLTVVEYCNDMMLSMYNSMRICHEESRMIYIVGRESAVLGYHFCNSKIVYEIARSLGLVFDIRQERCFKNGFANRSRKPMSRP